MPKKPLRSLPREVIDHPDLSCCEIEIRYDEDRTFYFNPGRTAYEPEEFARLVRLMEGALSQWKLRKEVEDAGADTQKG